jgi:TPR repeat protein
MKVKGMNMNTRSWILSAVITYALAGCAATYESAEESFQTGDIEAARAAWTELANDGDVPSMYRLYTSANRPTLDDVQWLAIAADSGNADAQYDYSMFLLDKERYTDAYDYVRDAEANGSRPAKEFLAENDAIFQLWMKAEDGNVFDVTNLGEHYWGQKDYVNAIKWFERCIEENSYCSFYLGLAYAGGYGVEVDYDTSIDWYTQSALKGNKDSARNLAWIYENGNSGTVDTQQAFRWMTQAAQEQWPVPTAELGRYYLYGVGTPKNNQKAFELLTIAAPKNKFAAYNLARMYYFGEGIEKDFKQSFRWFEQAGKQNHRASKYYVAQHYYKGLGRDKNLSEARKWFKQAAELGDSDAQFRLGWMYSNAEGVEKSYRTAFNWYNKAAEQGHSAAQNNLGVMFAEGQGTEKDDYQAFKWYERAAKQGDEVAQNNLGVRYENGTGVRKSNELAAYWYATSAQNNYKNAQSNLDAMLHKLRVRHVNVKLTEVYKQNDFDSTTLLSIPRGEKAYVLSEGSQWTEVYYPKNNTIGYINNTHLN